MAHEIFHKHKQINDDELKVHLKNKLDADEYCVHQLRKLEDSGVDYDELWDEKLYSAVSILIILIVLFVVIHIN